MTPRRRVDSPPQGPYREAERKGRAARARGEPEAANPYNPELGSISRGLSQAWRRGWHCEDRRISAVNPAPSG